MANETGSAQGLRIGLLANNPNFPGAWATTVEKIRVADELGYDSVWLGETWGYDLVSRLTELVLTTNRIEIGAGIFNVFSRSPGVIASTMATLDERSGGRMRCGLGSSGGQVIEHWHGVPFEKPLRRIREYTEIINMMIRREKLVYHGEIFTLERGFKLQIAPPREHIPIYIAAITPKSIEQSGEIADGILPIYWPSSRLPDLRARLDQGAQRAGRAPRSTQIAAYITVAIITDERQRAAARDKAREPIAFYVGRMGKFYAEMLARQGYAAEVAAIIEGWQVGPEAARAAVSDALLDDTAIIGTVDEVRSTLTAWHARGLDQALISLPPGEPEETRAILTALIR
jgi:F420-dependent oxidoreductase-like protein